MKGNITNKSEIDIKQCLMMIGAVLMLIGLISACDGLSTDPEIVATIPPPPTDIPLDTLETPLLETIDLRQGARLFAEHCTACHGITGQGNGELVRGGQISGIPDFSDPATIEGQRIEDYFEIITNGRLDSLMPPWGESLTIDERWAVAWFVYTLSDDSLIADLPTLTAPISTEEARPEITEVIGTVYGGITQGTEGGIIPDNISVALHVMDAQFSELDFQTTLSEAGEFTFDDILINSTYNYLITAVYNDTVFTSELIVGDPYAGLLQMPITIYEATDDPSVVDIDLLLTQIRTTENGDLYVSQVMNFRNTSDRMFTTETTVDTFRTQSVTIALPEGAQLIPTDELIQRFLLDEATQTLYDTEPVLPNSEHTVFLNYTLPYVEGMTIAFPVHYDLSNNIEVMVEPETFAIESTMIRNHGAQHFANGVYNSYLGDPISAGEQVRYTLHSADLFTPHQTTRTRGVDATVMLMGGGGIILLFIAGVIFFINQQRQITLTNAEILDALVDLDKQFKAGMINQRAYQTRRKGLKAQLAKRMDSQQSPEEGT